MTRTRALVALSAILVAPLAASLVVFYRAPEPAVAVAWAPEVAPAPAPAPVVVVVPEVEVEPEPELDLIHDPPSAERDPGQAMLLLDGALVVSTSTRSEWAAGRLTIAARPGHLTAHKPVSWDRLTEPARGLGGATVVVYDSDGSACVATVGAARLHLERSGEVFPLRFGEDGEDDASYEPPESKRVLRDMVGKTFELASDRLLLATTRAQSRRPCRGEWARRADLPAPQVFGRKLLPRSDADGLQRRALPFIRAQPEFTALAAAYAEHRRDRSEDSTFADEPDWDGFVAAHLEVTRWDEIGGPRRIVSVELRAPREPCSDDFSGTLALLLEEGPEGLLRLPQPGFHDLAALMDIDRDGTLEAVTHSSYGDNALEAEGPSARALADSYMLEYFGCPC